MLILFVFAVWMVAVVFVLGVFHGAKVNEWREREEPVSLTNECPFCRADLLGAAIPAELREHKPDCEEQKAKFGGHCYCLPYGEDATHFSRLLGIEISEVYDGVLMWQCPDCKTSWPAWDEGRRREAALARGARPLP